MHNCTNKSFNRQKISLHRVQNVSHITMRLYHKKIKELLDSRGAFSPNGESFCLTKLMEIKTDVVAYSILWMKLSLRKQFL